ncbi:MAG: hypothetical protein ABI181_01620 [Mycobacteriaceae bacterium]
MLLASCTELPDGDGDDAELLAALRTAGLDASWAPWDHIAPDEQALVVLRATWDYTRRHAEFLRWAQQVPRLANPAAAVRFSSDKRYLLDLAADGVAVVPTTVVLPGATVPLPTTGPVREVVVKPSIGAGSDGAARFVEALQARAHVAQLHAQGSAVLIQPFVASVDTAGETAMVFLAGRRSHAFHKAAMLAPAGAPGERDPSGLFLIETLRPHAPSDAEWTLAGHALSAAAARCGLGRHDLLYARVDTLTGPAGPMVLEVELVEPSLGWRQVPGPQRAAALSGLVEAVRTLDA